MVGGAAVWLWQHLAVRRSRRANALAADVTGPAFAPALRPGDPAAALS